MKPVGGVRRERPGEIRHNMPVYVADREGVGVANAEANG